MKTWTLRREDLLLPSEWQKLKSSLNARAELAEKRRRFTAVQERAICFVLVWTGARRAELAALTCGDVHLLNDRPYIVIRMGKGGRYREVVISPDCRVFLKRFLKAKEAHGQPVTDDAPLFLPQRGNRYSGSGVARVWRNACHRAGIPIRSAHKARHFFASRLYQATRDIKQVQRQLGHSKITTSQVYVELEDSELFKGMEAMDRLLQVDS